MTGYDDPTPPLDTFLVEYENDHHAWWKLQSGHHMNLFEEAVQRMEIAEARLEKIRLLTVDGPFLFYDDAGPFMQPYPIRAILGNQPEAAAKEPGVTSE